MPLRDSRGRFAISMDLDNRSAISSADQIILKMEQVANQALKVAEDLEKKQARISERNAAQMQAAYTAAFNQIAAGAARMALDVARAGAQAIDSATAKSQATAEKFGGTRGSLRELAQLQGVPLDAAFVRNFAAQNVRTGMTPQEAIAFRTQALNSGAQYIGEGAGNNMTTPLAQRYIDQAATLARSRGLEASVAGDLTGRILGFRDYKAEGAAGPSAALSTFNQVAAILDAGVGQAPQLVGQFNQLAASSLDATGEDRGAFTNAADVATAISIASQKSPGRAFTGTQSAIKQLRNFDNPLVQAAGITPQDSFEAALRKLAPVVEARADRFGVKPIDVLMKGKSEASSAGFEDDLGAQMVETFISQGIRDDLFNKRRAVGVAAAAPGQAEGKIAAYRASTQGIADTRAAEAEAVDVERGMTSERMTVLRQEAINQLKAEGKLDTTSAEFREGISKGLSGGFLPSLMQSDIDERVRRNVEARLPQGVSIRSSFQTEASGLLGGGGFVSTNESKTAEINRAAIAAEAMGVNVLQRPDERSPAAIPSEPPVDPDWR